MRHAQCSASYLSDLWEDCWETAISIKSCKAENVSKDCVYCSGKQGVIGFTLETIILPQVITHLKDKSYKVFYSPEINNEKKRDTGLYNNLFTTRYHFVNSIWSTTSRDIPDPVWCKNQQTYTSTADVIM